MTPYRLVGSALWSLTQFRLAFGAPLFLLHVRRFQQGEPRAPEQPLDFLRLVRVPKPVHANPRHGLDGFPDPWLVEEPVRRVAVDAGRRAGMPPPGDRQSPKTSLANHLLARGGQTRRLVRHRLLEASGADPATVAATATVHVRDDDGRRRVQKL